MALCAYRWLSDRQKLHKSRPVPPSPTSTRFDTSSMSLAKEDEGAVAPTGQGKYIDGKPRPRMRGWLHCSVALVIAVALPVLMHSVAIGAVPLHWA